MPELSASYHRGEFDTPARYPVAYHPQAWAAAVIPFLLQTCLGLVPEAPTKRLLVVRPRLPNWSEEVNLYGLRFGSSTVDLQFKRHDSRVQVQEISQTSQLDVVLAKNDGETRNRAGHREGLV